MSERPTPETDNNDYAYAFLEQYGYESSLQDAPVDWADFARRLERERDTERSLADRLAEGLRKMVLYSESLILRIQDRSDINFKTLNEGIDLFNEWKEVRSE